MFASLIRFIRVKARSRAILVGVVAATFALVSGWALAGFNPGHQATGSLSSARRSAPAQAGSNVTENGNAPQAAGPQTSRGSTGPDLGALGPDGRIKHSPKRARTGHHKSDKTTCPSGGFPAPGSTVNGGLVVDGDCTITGVTINGGVVIEGTGHLTLYGSTVNGGTDVRPNGEFDSDFPAISGGGNTLNGGVSEEKAFDMDIWNSTVRGRILFNGGPTGTGFTYSACGMHLLGDFTMENIVGSGTEIGDASNCAVNTISGSVHIRNSDSISVELEFGVIGGSVDIWNSHPAVTGNTIGGSLLCHQGATLGHYDSDDSTPNAVHGTNTCA